MAKVSRTTTELEQELDQQLTLLKVGAENYDKGTELVAKTMATTIRVLVHDTSASHSLLGQLGRKGGSFVDTATEMIHPTGISCSQSGLVMATMGPGGTGFKPHLEKLPQGGSGKLVTFDHWWNATVFRDQEGNTFTRRDLVLALANQDGGAHVDPQMDEKYHKLTRQNSLGWASQTQGEPWKPLTNPHYPAVRQIAHELLKSIDPGYRPPGLDKPTGGIGFAIAGVHIVPVAGDIAPSSGSPWPTPRRVRPKKIGRNDPCFCGSGRKYKKCHGKG